jgi:tetratricopeptide (TPR) repeat protein
LIKGNRVFKSAALAAVVLVSACSQTGGLDRLLNGPPLPQADARGFAPGVDAQKLGADGLLVGHRLMAANEPELALKAYLRAAGELGATADVLSAIGSANLALGRLGQAEQILRRAIEADPSFVPAQNNLGVVLMERGQVSQARLVFERAFALDSGQSDAIRENLKQAVAVMNDPIYTKGQDKNPVMYLVRRGQGDYVLLSQL